VRLQSAGRVTKLSLPKLSVLALAAGLLALAGCGSSSSTSSSASTPAAPATPATTSSAAAATPAPATGSSTVSLSANPEGQLKYNTTALTAKAGKVSINFTNTAPEDHNVTIESSGTTVGSTPSFQGGAKTVSVNLKPGTYKFFCSVPGHRQAGMEGTLTVQ
jgi:plastocyanin